MTDISTIAPTAIRRVRLPIPSIPIPVLRVASVGAAFAAICGSVGKAMSMACVDPYAAPRREEQAPPEADLDGRDPGW